MIIRRKMNKKIAQINEFLEGRNALPLSFRGLKEEDKPSNNLELNDLVLECIRLTSYYPSINSGVYETGAGCWRSVFDIWRHVKFFSPETNIFQVMSNVYKIRGKLIGHYCPTISRRAFKAKIFSPAWGLDDKYFSDEFNLKFSDWRNLESLFKKEENATKNKLRWF